MRSRTSRSTT